jgi:diguanylate cyclase (GGDEF)-like protein/PAS domain S-box-containing protein
MTTLEGRVDEAGPAHEAIDDQVIDDAAIRAALADMLYAHPGIGVSAATVDGRIVHHDEIFAALLGRPGEDLRGLTYDDFLEGPDWTGLSKRIDRLEADHLDQANGYRRAGRPDGSTVWLGTTGRLVRMPGRAQPFVVCLIRDATQEVRLHDAAEAEAERTRRAASELEQAESEHLEVMDRSPAATIVHAGYRICYANRAALALFGARDLDELTAHPLIDLIHPESRAVAAARIAALEAGSLPADEPPDLRLLRLDGSEFLGRPAGTHRMWQGRPTIQVTITDVTAARRAELTLAAREQFHTEILDSMATSTAVLDAAGRVLSFNRAWSHFVVRLGRPDAAEVGTDFLELCRTENSRNSAGAWALADGLRAMLDGDEDRLSMDIEVSYADGDSAWFSVSVTPLTGPDGGVVVSLTDISERKAFEDELGRQATHDPLTGLPNRLLLQDRLERAVAAQSRRASCVAVLFVDIDNFKLVNDSYGHEAGDAVLLEVARLLDDAMRPTDTVARFGGDEFVVVVEEVTETAAVVALAERILSVLGGSYAVSATAVTLSVSIGVAIAADTDTASDLMRNADTAMFEAKAAGRDRVAVFDSTVAGRSRSRLETSHDLRHALARREFELFYQPILKVRTGATSGVEALLRWRRPRHGLVLPNEFIGIAEDSGLVVGLGEWVLDSAVKWAAHTCAPSVSVNVAARQLTHPGYARTVAETLARWGLPPARLTLELTESTVMDDPAAATLVLDELKSLGVRLSIDDFGTGYSSLAYLQRFPVDELKIDRSFVDGLGTEQADDAIVRAIVSLAHTLRLIVVAEGIETAVQLQRLTDLGCERAQGFLISAPLEADAAHEWMRAHH